MLSIRKAASTGLPRTMSTLALRAGNSSPCKWTAMPRALCNFALMVLSFSAALPSLVCLLAISSPGKSSTRMAARHNLYRHVRRACEMPLLVQQDAQKVKGACGTHRPSTARHRGTEFKSSLGFSIKGRQAQTLLGQLPHLLLLVLTPRLCCEQVPLVICNLRGTRCC